MGFLRQGEVVFHRSRHRTSSDIHGSVLRDRYVNVAGVIAEGIGAVPAEIADVDDFPARSVHAHARPGYGIHVHIATNGRDVELTVADVGKCDGTVQRLDMYGGVAEVAGI